MRRIEAVEHIVKALPYKTLVVSNLGYPSRELHHVHDRPRNFYMLGSMGLASSIGLGLALARKEKTVVLDGDGSILMNLGSLVTIANQKPGNLILVVLDNQCYGTTGGQPSYASGVTNIEALAKAAGITKTKTVRIKKRLVETLENTIRTEGPFVIVVKVDEGNAKVPLIPMKPEDIKERFMASLQAERSTPTGS
ncbi:MAG: sulfopyruvate decarboxylase subunit beta [Thermoproteota archaeon]|nr:sulfopyruvate decarboxylase subunit beta [Thermoproteota archaeon]